MIRVRVLGFASSLSGSNHLQQTPQHDVILSTAVPEKQVSNPAVPLGILLNCKQSYRACRRAILARTNCLCCMTHFGKQSTISTSSLLIDRPPIPTPAVPASRLAMDTRAAPNGPAHEDNPTPSILDVPFKVGYLHSAFLFPLKSRRPMGEDIHSSSDFSGSRWIVQ